MENHPKRRAPKMKMSYRWIGPAVVCGALLFASCGSARRGVPLTVERELTNPKLQLGAQVFYANCSQCHPGGESGLGPALNNKPAPKWLIKFQVRNGLGVMPSFPTDEISGEELDAVVDYMKWLRRLPAPEEV